MQQPQRGPVPFVVRTTKIRAAQMFALYGFVFLLCPLNAAVNSRATGCAQVGPSVGDRETSDHS